MRHAVDGLLVNVDANAFIAAKCLKIRCQTPLSIQRLKQRWTFFQFPKMLRKITPGRATAELPDHRFDKQLVIRGRHPVIFLWSRKQIAYPFSLIIPQSITSHRIDPLIG